MYLYEVDVNGIYLVDSSATVWLVPVNLVSERRGRAACRELKAEPLHQTPRMAFAEADIGNHCSRRQR